MKKNSGNVLVLILGVLALLFAVSTGYLLWQSQQKQTNGTASETTSTVTETPRPTNSPTIPPPVANNPVSTDVVLKVSAVGGGATGQRYDYTINFSKETDDTYTILKRNENEVKNFPNYVPGALDKGLVIKHGTTELEITPSFEGAGSPLDKKLVVVQLTNTKLVSSPIFRLKAADIYGPQNTDTSSIYTTQYKDQPGDCSAFNPGSGQPSPACIWGGAQVMLKDNDAVAISCSAENTNLTWCDNIVKSLSISVKKY